MTKSSPTTPDRLERIRKKELNSVEANKAMAEVERQAIAVRKNMERLKALRLARDAEEAAAEAVAPSLAAKAKRPAAKTGR